MTIFTSSNSKNDDMIIASDDPQAIYDLQCYLGKHFEIKDLGTLSYFLGLKISSSSNGYYFSQAKYVFDLLSRSSITDSATSSTPLDPTVQLTPFNGTLGHSLQFSSHSSLVLFGFFDADWTGHPTDRRSSTSYCIYLGDALISWRSKKQHVVSRSSTESEYRALADATLELIWLHWLLTVMRAPQRSPIILHCDNCSAIQIAHDVFHE
ncbi:putative mitochondrial protein [Cucumis melo var. makuwa]|uniref:Mitochondrial protein n=1 Tax=Cucumis melo var. makuwa TaxID=1194695 RepID=A0A5A7VIE1_CUCMM|nr:putative mitochondrial protein [Cucumis melo var. makuwa]TYK08741.1 putative mitochondrial protein [Cucumis melo var. makuwa]